MVLIAVTLSATSALAQATERRDPRQALTQYRMEAWQTEQGLPLNTVQALLQTGDGYLWVGTGGGLARFDGSSTTSAIASPTRWLNHSTARSSDSRE